MTAALARRAQLPGLPHARIAPLNGSGSKFKQVPEVFRVRMPAKGLARVLGRFFGCSAGRSDL